MCVGIICVLLQRKVFFFLISLSLTIHGINTKRLNVNKYFLVALKDGDLEDAIEIAEKNHYRFIKQVKGFDKIYLFEKVISSNGNEKRSDFARKSLEEDNRVLWASQQQQLIRERRDLFFYPYSDYSELSELNSLEFYRPLFNDELWNQQWYMQNSLNTSKTESLDLNVLPVYARGITGKNVRVAVLDDGLEYNHEDLIGNYDPEISWDCNNDVPDPLPNYKDFRNRHGTRCAGEIAMMANNKKCGVGIAFNSRIGGIKLLGGEVYDLIEGMALGFAHNKVDIYSSSWGPTDDGKTLERPGLFASMALKRGIYEGRNGRGSIYLWASGNGGSKKDNCNCDGYATSIYTITVGSVTQHGTMPWYSEKCASLLTVTYSSGALNDQMIATTDLKNSCTVKHTGTSASAPLAAGIIALGLEANPDLTWRDVQHIIVRTSEYQPLKNNEGWQKNGFGYFYNIQFGFGLMNADAFVALALKWKTVSRQYIEKILGYEEKLYENDINPNASIKVRNSTKVIFDYFNGNILYLEHIEITVNIDCRRRGNLKIFLTSPNGTRVPVLEKRARDDSIDGFKNWTFMSVATWSENPKGQWIMEIFDTDSINGFIIVGNCTLILYGTKTLFMK